ncbi:germin-like protein subfamily 1 member 13 [Mercurialis annua]|uniref:germin-like protein subfamily 1 member 13 n=1 Tax=Mercurialis annua TaxID=3986 RepID=UPI0024AE020A|nr:germin-like protein subfamily 1 member 13 [Mercurialis annua]
MKITHFCAALVAIVASVSSFWFCLEDFYVSTYYLKNGVVLNGKFSKHPMATTPICGGTSSEIRLEVMLVKGDTIPGFNKLGISVARIDYAPSELNSPVAHPHSSGFLVVVQGSLYFGFIRTYPDHLLITKTLKVGDVFGFPVDLIHFHCHIGTSVGVVFGGWCSQNPDAAMTPSFGSDTPINEVRLDEVTVNFLLEHFWTNHND